MNDGPLPDLQPLYGAHGVATFPVRPDKKPALRGYLKVSHPNVSERLAKRFPHADALGFALKPARIAVLDIDTPDENVLATRSISTAPPLSCSAPRAGVSTRTIGTTAKGVRFALRLQTHRRARRRLRHRATVTNHPRRLQHHPRRARRPRPPAPHAHAGRYPGDATRSGRAHPRGPSNQTLFRFCLAEARSCRLFPKLLERAMGYNGIMLAPPLSPPR